MQKYSDIAPLVKSNIKRAKTEHERKANVETVSKILSKYGASSINDLPLNVKSKLMNGDLDI